MKNIITLAFSLLVSSSAFAGNYSESTSWNVLLKAVDLNIDMPVVFMGHAVSYDFICQEGDMFRTKRKVDIVETKYGREHNREYVVGSEYLTTPINYTRTVSECRYVGKDRQVCEDQVVTGTYPTTVSVKVYQQAPNHRKKFDKYLFTKSFSVPHCE